MAAPRQQQQEQHDPFAGEFSQARATNNDTPSWPIVQWHGGLAALVGDVDSMKATGGFFIEDERIAQLGLHPDEPAPGFERVTLKLGGNMVAGWGAGVLHISFLFTDFCWEEKEGGRVKARFPHGEYERRKQQEPGAERNLRGRTRCLVGIQELLDFGVAEPVLLTMRGTYSRSLNKIIQQANAMSREATKLRRQAGHDGAIPREAFWVPVEAGAMKEEGQGTQKSTVASPSCPLPETLDRKGLAACLVHEDYRKAGGMFDYWAQMYEDDWQRMVGDMGGEVADAEAEYQQQGEGNGAYRDEAKPEYHAEPDNGESPVLVKAKRAVSSLVAQNSNLPDAVKASTAEDRNALIAAIMGHGWAAGGDAIAVVPGFAEALLNKKAEVEGLKRMEARALADFLGLPESGELVDELYPA
jgi:hypothetical protein